MSPVVERNLRVHAAKDARSYDAANRAESLGYQGKEVPWAAVIVKSGGEAWPFRHGGSIGSLSLNRKWGENLLRGRCTAASRWTKEQ